VHTRCEIRSGSTGRGADRLQGHPVVLEVFSKGTCATGWEDIEHTTTDEEGVSKCSNMERLLTVVAIAVATGQ
jgi:hypothetical protein